MIETYNHVENEADINFKKDKWKKKKWKLLTNKCVHIIHKYKIVWTII